MAKKKDTETTTSFSPSAAVEKLGAEIDKLLKSSVKGVSIQSLDDIDYVPFYLSTGNYALNWAMTGKFTEGGIPGGKITLFYGDPGCLDGETEVEVEVDESIASIILRQLPQKTNLLTKVIVKTKIKKLFDAFEQQSGQINFFQFRNVDGLKVRDENNNFVSVKALIKKVATRVLFNNTLCVASNHKFGDGRLAGNLVIGDFIKKINGDKVQIRTIEKLEEAPVYDWEIDSNTHLYSTTDGVIHHNSGKSLWKYKFAAEIIKLGGLAYDIDTEDAANKGFVKKIASDSTGDIVRQMKSVDGVETIEDMGIFLSNMCELKIAKKDDTPIFVAIDSISQLPSKKETVDMIESKEAKDFTRFQESRKIFKVLGVKLRKANITLFITAHTSSIIGGFGNPVGKSTHGKGVDFANSLTAWITSNQEIKMPGKDKVALGVKMRFKITKNRAVYKNRNAEVNFLFNGSIQRYSGLLELLGEFEVIGLSTKKIGASTKFYYNSNGSFEKKKVKRDDVEKFVEEGWKALEDDGKGKTVTVVKGDEVKVKDLKTWIDANGGEEKVLAQWEQELNNVMDGIDPKKDDPSFFENDEETSFDVDIEESSDDE